MPGALRRTIIAAAPMAEETIRYRIPAYKYYGPLVFFAAFPGHLIFFGVSKPVLAQFPNEIAPFRASSTTFRFSADCPLPASLVTRIVKAWFAENEKKAAEKKMYGR